MPSILSLTELTMDDVAVVGGKAAALGEMLRAGFAVPPGFVLTTAAQDEGEATALRSAFASLGTRWVAVRSSATAEDAPGASWAGQFDSFLQVTEDDLLDRVRACRASLHSERAAAYRRAKGIDVGEVAMAVIVQAMVGGEVSGIAFSVHPVTGDTGQIVIEAGPGTGEAYVSGAVTPDHYVVAKDGEIVQIIPAEDGVRALDDFRILELAAIVRRIEMHAGHPCDIEWTFGDGVFSVLQRRPITTL